MALMMPIQERDKADADVHMPSVSAIGSEFHYRMKPLHAFGFCGIHGKGSQLACIDDDTIAFAMGCKLAVYRIATNEMRFVTLGSSTEKILYIVASPSRNLLGVCEKMRNAPSQVSIVSLTKYRKVQTLIPGPDVVLNGDFQSCGFSKDEASVVAALNSEESYLVCWHRKSGHVGKFFFSKENDWMLEPPTMHFTTLLDDVHDIMASTIVPLDITGVSINPDKNEEVATHGPGHFKLWIPAKQYSLKDVGVQGLQGKYLPKVTFTDHCWLLGGIVAVATLEGTIFVLKEGTLQMKVAETGHILCLCATNNGCLSANVDGVLAKHSCVEITDVPAEIKGKFNLEWKTTVIQSGYGQITTIAVSAKFKKILYVVEGEEVRRICIDDIDDNTILIEDKLPVSSKICAFNFGAVHGMDICEQHQILATCASDKVVRLWSYSRMTLEISHPCDLEPLCVALNPWGYELLVGLPRTVSVFRIMATKLEHFRDVPITHCHIVRFSPSGHLVAFASGRNIYIHSAFTWKFIAMLKGHLSLVTSLSWSADSIYLATAGNDGAIYIWFMDGCHRVQECVRKGSNYTSILFDPLRESVVSCGPQLPLRVMDTDKKQARYILETFSNTDYLEKSSTVQGSSAALGGRRKTEIVEAGEGWVHHIFRANIVFELPLAKPVVHLAGLFRKGLIVTSTSDGELRASMYPLARDMRSPVEELLLHSGEITSLITDEKRNLIFTSSAQGAVYISSLIQISSNPELESSVLHAASSEAVDGITQDCLLVLRTEYDETIRVEQELRMNLEKERRDAPYKQRVLEQQWVMKVKAREDRLHAIQDSHKEEVKLLERQQTKMQKEMENTMKELLADSQKNLRQLEDSFGQKVCNEVKRADQFKIDHDLEREVWRKELEDERHRQVAEIEDVKRQFEVVKLQAELQVKEAQKKCEEEIKDYKGFMEEDLLINEEELQANFMQLREYIEVKEKRVDRVREEMLVERRNNNKLQQQIISLQEMCKSQDVTITDLEAEVTKLQDMIIQAEQRTRAVDEIFLLTDVHIKSLLSQHKEQKTMALVREMQIKELRRKEEPLEKELGVLRSDMHQMERLQILHTRKQARKDEFAKGLRGRIQMQDNQIHRLTLILLEKERYMDVFTEALCRIVCDHDVSEWPELTKNLFMAYVNKDTQFAVQSGLESRTEMMHQRQTLENYLAVLKDAAERSEARHFKETRHYMQDNLRLLSDFADANRNVRRLAFVVKHLQGEVSYYRAIAARSSRDATSKFRVQFSRLSQAPNFGGTQSRSTSQSSPERQSITSFSSQPPSRMSGQIPSPDSSPSRSSSPQQPSTSKGSSISGSSSPQMTSTRGSSPQTAFSRLTSPGLLPPSRGSSPVAVNLAQTPVQVIDSRAAHSPSRASDITTRSGAASPEPSSPKRSDSHISFADSGEQEKGINPPQDVTKQGEVKVAGPHQVPALERRRGSSPVGEILKNLYMVAPNQAKRLTAIYRRGQSVPGLIPGRKSIEVPRAKSVIAVRRPKSVSGESSESLLARIRQAKMELKQKQEEIRQLQLALSMVGTEGKDNEPRNRSASADLSQAQPAFRTDDSASAVSTPDGLQPEDELSAWSSSESKSGLVGEGGAGIAGGISPLDLASVPPTGIAAKRASVMASAGPPDASTASLAGGADTVAVVPGNGSQVPPSQTAAPMPTATPGISPMPQTSGMEPLATATSPSPPLSIPAVEPSTTNSSIPSLQGSVAGGSTLDKQGAASGKPSSSSATLATPGKRTSMSSAPMATAPKQELPSPQAAGSSKGSRPTPAADAPKRPSAEFPPRRKSSASPTPTDAPKRSLSSVTADTRKSGVTISPAGFPIDVTRTYRKSTPSVMDTKVNPETKKDK